MKFVRGYKPSEEVRKKLSEAQKAFQKTGLNKKARHKLYPWEKSLDNIGKRIYCKDSTYRKKGIKNFLTIHDLKVLWFRDKAYEMSRPSLDRVDNDGHYVFSNCRYLEYSINSGRSNVGNTRRRGKKMPSKAIEKIRSSQKRLWRIPKYRDHMSKVHRKEIPNGKIFI